LQNSGETTTIRIVEKLPREKRNSNPMAYGYQPPQEREVGRVTIE
jgi:axial budding pattern protein 2